MAEPYLSRLRDLVRSLALDEIDGVEIECRHFFGGAAIYADGKICGSLTPVGLALKVPPKLREELLENGRGVPLRYFDGGKIKKEYVLLNDESAARLPGLRALFDVAIDHSGNHP